MNNETGKQQPSVPPAGVDSRPLPPVPGAQSEDNAPGAERLPEELCDDDVLRQYDVPPLANAGCLVRAFSFKGRITRAEFLLSHLLVLVYALSFKVVSVYTDVSSLFVGDEAAHDVYVRLAFANLFVFCWFYTAQGMKRCHDVGWSGWRFYIPFINVLLLFKRREEVQNRYGMPAVLTPAEPVAQRQAAALRQHGIVCGLAWLLFSPVYLLLAMKWRVQNWLARIVLFVLSPFFLCAVYTTCAAVERQQAGERSVNHARAALNEAVIGIKLARKVTGIEQQHNPKNGNAEVFLLTLADGQPAAALLDKAAQLAATPESGWAVFVNESSADTEDYGYYREDYGGSATDTVPVTVHPEIYQFEKTVRLKGDRDKSRVSLVLRRSSNEAVLTIVPAAGGDAKP